MTPAPLANNPASPPKSYRLAIAWIAFLAVLLSASAYKAQENRRDLAQQQAWHERMAQLQEDAQQEVQRVDTLLESLWKQPGARATLEQELNNGQPFEVHESEGREVANWVHPEYNLPVQLSFSGDELRGFSLRGANPGALPENAQPRMIRLKSRAERIRQAVRPIAIACFVVAVLIACFVHRYSWIAANLMMFAALTYGAATVVAPNYNLSVQGIVSNDAMFFAVIMYLIALAAMASTWPTVRHELQFRLRELLVAFTLAAILLSMGPLGYFALVVFAIGSGLLFTLVRLRTKADGRAGGLSNAPQN
ncbi:hypothetical protein [Aeoliella mucimassa]|uniref:Uncharacterized protein n=1 Tax=Aeoliella mucimassa TaxID=2527972 RepID=A0A518AHL8_9BACT|nr:hypothetical protein [Aeoliella mucimassa]QDU54228.1 hypothetical protein Pan181_04080 [Aeoliella mucimassa]